MDTDARDPPFRRRAGSLLVGVTAGCWVGYIVVYPVSSLPLSRYTVVLVAGLGAYVDRLARSMLNRLLVAVGAAAVAYVVGVCVAAFPALVGWYADPAVRRALYFTALRETFPFGLLAMTLLLTGMFASYVLRNAYAELTR